MTSKGFAKHFEKNIRTVLSSAKVNYILQLLSEMESLSKDNC